ncbi:7a2d2a2e-9fc4-4d91-9a49-0e4ddcb84c60 [Sclerotinia trifoliorum]|uniref:7a2d2a2e-9fc4-4d91-9a49-0e4ddcb84c60 n=1 Tax=Sclerotinia trifoliorum TaxID=28548 RepID=A0A8H2ZLY4_9HELO|nr:7a2d2a2e-9fc4-4d91-9a49-0e4ddcb84c60 [Sclerotinia trifoliorum]
MSSRNRTVGHGRFESDGKVSEIIDMYGDMKVSRHTSRNTGSGDKIDPKTSRGRNAPHVSTWSASTASTASDGDRTSRVNSKRSELPIQSKGQAQGFEDKYFRPSSSVMRSPPRTPERRTSPSAKNRVIQGSDDNTTTKNTNRQNTLRDLEGNSEKPLPLTPGSRRRVETAAKALKDAQEERRQERNDNGRQAKTDKLPREPAPVRR